MYKRDIINFLFLISFPMFGIGTYVSAYKSPSLGYLISVLPHFLIILFYVVDLLYKRIFEIKLNGLYILMVLYVISAITALFIALGNDLPEATMASTFTKSIMLLTPLHGFVVVIMYNKDHEGALTKLTLISLSLLLFINVVGFFGLRISNAIHSIDGRLSFPFIDGFYSGASLLAIINLLLLYYLRNAYSNPIRFVSLGTYFIFNMVLFLMINSRLTTMIILLVVLLMLFRAVRVRGLYLLSMFTLPILLSSGAIIYKVIQLPGLASLLRRVDIEDVTTFNGRAYLWQDAINWLTTGQEGLWLGNGYKGHYFLGLITDVAKLWNEKNANHLHLHSTSLEILVCQGIVVFALFSFILYKIYKYYRSKHHDGLAEGAFFPVIVFFLFIMQVDTFLYDESLGFVILSLLVANVAVTIKRYEPNVRPIPREYLDLVRSSNSVSNPEYAVS